MIVHLHLCCIKNFEGQVPNMQIKRIVDQFEKDYTISDMPKSGTDMRTEYVFKPFEALLRLHRGRQAMRQHFL